MNNVRRFLFLVYACCANVTSAFILFRSPISSNISQRSSPITHHAGEPLLLTPLIDAGKLEEARNRSRVSPLGDVESYAAFLTVNETTKSHLYFWFIPKTTTGDHTTAPVILWLQGGPGCSSLFGLFTENGPFELTENGVERRVYAWTNNYHMLYIDQPVGTGFSFSETHHMISSEKDVGEHLYAALVQFFKLFSEFKDHDFYIAGESYAGKYIPAIGHKIHATRQQPNIYPIRLKGMMIGNGFSDPENMLEMAEFLYGIGMIDKDERRQLEVIQNEIKYHIRSGNWLQAASEYGNLEGYGTLFAGLESIYDYTSDISSDVDDSYFEFLNDDQFRRRIHAGEAKYQSCSDQVYDIFESAFMQTSRPTIEELLDHYPMLFYNGQFDISCAHSLTENYLDKLHWSGAVGYASAKKQIWRVGSKVAGYYKSGFNLVYAIVRNAGHMVPFYQPEYALNLIDMFIEKKFFQDNSTRSQASEM